LIPRLVVYSPEARSDLRELYFWIADAASPEVAHAYLIRVARWLASFDIASERRTRRDDVRHGLRTVGFERRLTVAFTVSDSEVRILRVLRAGQDWRAALSSE
jgi:toxin ParE1/3/4